MKKRKTTKTRKQKRQAQPVRGGQRREARPNPADATRAPSGEARSPSAWSTSPCTCTPRRATARSTSTSSTAAISAAVGYQRYNKRTGKVVDWGDVIKGYEYKKGQYVALTDEDFRRANVEASQTIDIVSFAEQADIPFEYFEQPYYLEPTEGGEKTYVLLREAMRDASKVAIGSFVNRGRQHFCAIVVRGRALMLNTLRFAEELVAAEDLDLPSADARSAKVSRQEVAMARRLVEEMSDAWKPERFKDTYRRDLMRRINEKIRKRQTHELTEAVEPTEERPSAEVIDLMAVLKRSLEKSGGTRSRRKAA